MKKVEVTWIDSAAMEPAWVGRDETGDTVKCRSVGYLVERTPRRIVIAQSFTADQYGHLLAIPTVAVRRVRKL